MAAVPFRQPSMMAEKVSAPSAHKNTGGRTAQSIIDLIMELSLEKQRAEMVMQHKNAVDANEPTMASTTNSLPEDQTELITKRDVQAIRGMSRDPSLEAYDPDVAEDYENAGQLEEITTVAVTISLPADQTGLSAERHVQARRGITGESSVEIPCTDMVKKHEDACDLRGTTNAPITNLLPRDITAETIAKRNMQSITKRLEQLTLERPRKVKKASTRKTPREVNPVWDTSFLSFFLATRKPINSQPAASSIYHQKFDYKYTDIALRGQTLLHAIMCR
jgi:hypothetical protein